jgi:hypothetical protein
MATNTKLKPFQSYDDHDVLTIFRYSGSIPVTAGTVVKPNGSGWRSDDCDTDFLGDVGYHYNNTVSQRFGVRAVCVDAGTGDPILGMLLNDVREVDENGIPSKIYPQKWAENNWIISGQASPILTKGWVLWSGTPNGSPVAGDMAYPSGNGTLTNNPVNQTNGSTVGKFWGSRSSDGYYLLKVDVR